MGRWGFSSNTGWEKGGLVFSARGVMTGKKRSFSNNGGSERKKKKKVEPNSSKGAVRFAGQTTGLTSPISIRPLSGPIDRIRLEP